MKIALFNDHRPGLVRGDRIIDFSHLAGDAVMGLPAVLRMPALLERFSDIRPAVEALQGGVPLSEVQLRAPVPRPGKILCAIGNYMEGVSGLVLPLGMFLKASNCILDPGGTVVLPKKPAKVFHHEAELCVVIGKGGRDITPAEAMDHVFGYTCMMDVSARGLTSHGRTGWYVDKSYDTFAPLGPWIVTRDEIPNPQKLSIKLSVDGQPRQDYNTDDMEHPVAELVSWASESASLEPGDIISCGTNHQGLGPLQDGETTTMEIDGIGRLTVNVRDPFGRSWPKEVDTQLASFVRAARQKMADAAVQAKAEAEPAR